MAKKPKSPKPDAEQPSGAPESEKPAGSRSKRIIIAAAVVVLLGAGGGGWWFMAHKKSPEQAVAEAEKRQATFLDLKEMLVNLSSPGAQAAAERPRYLKLKVSLEVADPKVAAAVQPLLPRIEDAFVVYTRELRASDLEGSSGVYRLKEELLRRVNIAVHPAKVDAVLFKEMLVQ